MRKKNKPTRHRIDGQHSLHNGFVQVGWTPHPTMSFFSIPLIWPVLIDGCIKSVLGIMWWKCILTELLLWFLMLTKQRPRLFSTAVYTEVQAILKVKKKDRMAKPMSDKPKAKLINTNRNKWRLRPNQKKASKGNTSRRNIYQTLIQKRN